MDFWSAEPRAHGGAFASWILEATVNVVEFWSAEPRTHGGVVSMFNAHFGSMSWAISEQSI